MVFLFGALPYVQAQRANTGNNSAASAVYQKKVDEVKACEELNLQLTKLFGAQYSLRDERVQAQLKRNIRDKQASRCIRKKSLYAIYGEDYVNHLELINDGAKQF